MIFERNETIRNENPYFNILTTIITIITISNNGGAIDYHLI